MGGYTQTAPQEVATLAREGATGSALCQPWIISPLARERRLKAKHGVELLKLYRCIALHVLEDAEWLKAFSPTESERIRDEIATKVEVAELQIEALQLLDDHQAEDTIKGGDA